jgi:hypothetical protein
MLRRGCDVVVIVTRRGAIGEVACEGVNRQGVLSVGSSERPGRVRVVDPGQGCVDSLDQLSTPDQFCLR